MLRSHRSKLAVIAWLGVLAGSAQAQYWGRYGGYGGYGGGQTVAGSAMQGMGVLAAGAGQYNVQTAQANAINANTAMQYNQYLYESKLEGERIYHERLARDKSREAKGSQAVAARLRDNPTEGDIARGDALNVVMNELTDPKLYEKALYYAGRMKVGGEQIRDIPFNYASAAISISVHQLTQGGAPPILRTDPRFAEDRTALRAIAAELRKEGDETGIHKPETIQKAKDQILATKAKVEATLKKGTPDRTAADKFIKALYGFMKMMETPAVDVLLAGVEKHPEASLGDLMKFMTTFNLRFGVAETPRQRAVYTQLYPMLAQVRTELRSGAAPAPGVPAEAAPTQASANAPLEAFDNLSYDQIDGAAGAVPPDPCRCPIAPRFDYGPHPRDRGGRSGHDRSRDRAAWRSAASGPHRGMGRRSAGARISAPRAAGARSNRRSRPRPARSLDHPRPPHLPLRDVCAAAGLDPGRPRRCGAAGDRRGDRAGHERLSRGHPGAALRALRHRLSRLHGRARMGQGKGRALGSEGAWLGDRRPSGKADPSLAAKGSARAGTTSRRSTCAGEPTSCRTAHPVGSGRAPSWWSRLRCAAAPPYPPHDERDGHAGRQDRLARHHDRGRALWRQGGDRGRWPRSAWATPS